VELDLRDWFAAEAMKALVAKKSVPFDDLAAEAYALADFMVEERAKVKAPKYPPHPHDLDGLAYPTSQEISYFNAGHKINAIKAMRTRLQAAGLAYGLKECKDACEAYCPLGQIHPDALKQNPFFK
jgi:ribosomal protein L7/L12